MVCKIILYFDSHSRDNEGKISQVGVSILMKFSSLRQVQDYISENYLTAKSVLYQIQYISVELQSSNSFTISSLKKIFRKRKLEIHEVESSNYVCKNYFDSIDSGHCEKQQEAVKQNREGKTLEVAIELRNSTHEHDYARNNNNNNNCMAKLVQILIHGMNQDLHQLSNQCSTDKGTNERDSFHQMLLKIVGKNIKNK